MLRCINLALMFRGARMTGLRSGPRVGAALRALDSPHAKNSSFGKSSSVTLTVSWAAPRKRLLAEPDFRRLWLVGLVVFSVRWLEMLAVAVFAYQHTGSPFIVALLTMLRMLPMTLFGAPIGAAAERIERRTLLVIVVLSMLLCSIALAALAWSGRLE